MKIRVLWVGRTKNAALLSVCQDMAGRIRRMAAFELRELREVKADNDERRIAAEAERLLNSIRASDYLVALDQGGHSYSSKGIADMIGKHMVEDPRDLVFMVGGPAGLSGALRRRADLVWSFSELTFSHDMARAVLMEQIYRALSIIHNLPYAR